MNSDLRRLALFKQGLSVKQPIGEGFSGTLSAIEHLGYVQIDTISVVERAHHHVLWNRVSDYDLVNLNKLVSERHVFEYWYHAASYLPMRDYRYAMPQMVAIRNGENRYYSNGDPHLMSEILARVKLDGAIRLRDIDKDHNSKSNGWHATPARRAVEILFMQGDLMVCERDGMEKIYDLPERCLPKEIDLRMPTLDEYVAYILKTTLRAHGVFTWKQLLHLKVGKAMREAMLKVLNEYIEEGIVTTFKSASGSTMYVDVLALEQAPSMINLDVKILSPFDNLIIHRERLSALFQFDYRLECYVTASKRVFGYFCLPILYGDRIVGQVDCKVHRGEQRLEVLSLHLKNEPLDRDQFLPALRQELQSFAMFNKCLVLDDRIINGPHC